MSRNSGHEAKFPWREATLTWYGLTTLKEVIRKINDCLRISSIPTSPRQCVQLFFFSFFKLPQEEGSTLHSRPSPPEKNVPLVLANASSRNLSHSLSVHRSAGFSGMAGVFRSETDY